MAFVLCTHNVCTCVYKRVYKCVCVSVNVCACVSARVLCRGYKTFVSASLRSLLCVHIKCL